MIAKRDAFGPAVRRVAGAIAIYQGTSILFFGRSVIGDPSNRVVGDGGADKTLYLWSFVWWPRAVLHGANPLDVDVAWAPHGFDFGLGTAGGGLALAAAPLTSLAGPVTTYNALMLAAPALAATTAFVFAHHVTGKFAPSLLAGYIFGFSSYELGHLLGHLPLAFIALVHSRRISSCAGTQGKSPGVRLRHFSSPCWWRSS